MDSQKKSKGLFRAFRSASADSNLAKVPPGGPASSQSDSDSQSGQSSVDQKSQQSTLSPPIISRGRRFVNRFRKSPLSSPLPSPPPELEPHDTTTDHPIAASASSSGNHVSPSVPVVQGSASAPANTPINVPTIQVLSVPTATQSSAPPITGTSNISPAKSDAQATELPRDPDPIEPPSHSSIVWAKAVEIAAEKLIQNNLPPLNPTNLSTISEEENIEAVIKSLKALQEDEEKKRWSYFWRGKEVIVVKRLGEILRSVEKYSQVVGTAVQFASPVGGLVWASIQCIIQVCI